jgi:type IV pilus assembly protein PilM
MATNETILAIDIGACSLKIASFSFPQSGGLVLEGFYFNEFAGDLKDEEYHQALREALQSAVGEIDFNAKDVYFSFSGQSAFIRFVKLPPVGEEEDRIKQIVEFEAQQNVPYPMDEVIWDYQLIGNVNDESGIETMFVVVKNAIINELTSAVEGIGKDPVMIDVAPTAAYNAARANGIGEDDCSMILNIGGRCSSLIFIDSGRFFVRTIPIAGFTVTQQISKEFGISFTDAEELKKKHGFVALGGAYEEPDSEVAATVSKIVRNVMTRLHGEINRSINVYRSQQKGTKPSKLYLAGGSSVMAFTPRFFSEKLKMPVEYFNPFQVVSLSPSIDKEALAEVAHMFSEVIGLGLRKATSCPIEVSLVPKSIKSIQEFKKKTLYFYASAVSIVICLLILWWSIERRKDRRKNIIVLADKMLKKTDNKMNEVIEANDNVKILEEDYKVAKGLIQNRTKLVDILNEVQNLLPYNMWLVKFKPVKGSTSSSNDTRGGFYGLDSGVPSAAVKKDEAVQYLELEGHTLVFSNSSRPMEEKFKDELLKSKFFSDKPEDIVTTYKPPRGINNITEFTMTIKLKEPLKP